MSTYTLQVVILGAAYVLLVGAGVVNGLVGLYNWRLLQRLEGRKDLATRIQRVENAQLSFEELLKSFSSRLNRREGGTSSGGGRRKGSSPESSEVPSDGEIRTPQDVLRRLNSR